MKPYPPTVNDQGCARMPSVPQRAPIAQRGWEVPTRPHCAARVGSCLRGPARAGLWPKGVHRSVGQPLATVSNPKPFTLNPKP